MRSRRLWRVGIVASVFMAVLSLAAVMPVHASVNDFSFSDFEGDYYLSKDSSGRSIMTVTEQLTAQFPLFDQNKGIVRALPMSYDGHPVSLVFDTASLTRNGLPEPVYDRSVQNGNLDISTGTEQYLQGAQTYKFTYHLRDVTKDFGDHQELYWDTNGTEWSQPFDKVVARVHLDSSIAAAWTKDDACYEGAAGSNDTCNIETSKDDKGNTMITFTSSRQYGSGENLTYVLGFAKGTFQPYQLGTTDWLLIAVAGLVGVVAIGSIVWAIVLRATHRSAKGKGTIIPEYQPPKGISLMVASQAYSPANTKSIPAQIIELAVRHNLQIIEYDKPGIFGSSSKAYKLKLLTDEGLNDDEKEFATRLFGSLREGEEYDMGDPSAVRGVGIELTSFRQQIGKSMVMRGYRRAIPGRAIPAIISLVLTLGAFILTVAVSNSTVDGYMAGAAVTAMISVFVVSILIGGALPLTEAGAELRDYIKGLKLYIRIAEQDRLKVLQSVTGADREAIGDITDHAQLVKLYEKVLPYAVLVGLERSWGKVLEQYYAPDTSPAWYVGVGAFSMSDFTSSISSFAASTSSSSSGLGGGGSSGGGGGGGGGGGR